MTEKRFSVYKSEVTNLYVVNDNTHKLSFEGVEKASTVMKLVGLLNNYIEDNKELRTYSKALSEELSLANRDNTALENENEQLKKELFETRKELLWTTSDEVDRVLYYEDEVEELRKEIFK